MQGKSRHDEIFNFIKRFQADNFRMPTRKEIIYDCGITRGSVQRIIDSLEMQGRLKRLPKGILEFRIMK